MSGGAVREKLKKRMRELGLRATSNRVAVLHELLQAATPLSHESLMERLGGSHDVATVYRILSDLTEVGLLHRMDLGDRVWRYELHDTYHDADAHHAHFRCTSCGTVTCLPTLDVVPRSGQLPEHLIGVAFQIQVTGTCGTCVTV